MNHLLAIPLFLILTSIAAAQPTTTPPAIRFPVLVNPTPTPAPAGAVSKLGLAELYVIDSDIPILVFASPSGLVTLTEEVGPLRIRARFVDGNGKVQTKTFRGKHIFTIEAAQTGQVELIVVPVGASKTSDAIRRTLDVDAGEGPRPPPDPPKPPVPPDPKPPVPDPKPIPHAGFRVLMLWETSEGLPLKQHSVVHGKKVRDYLQAKCAVEPSGQKAFRLWDDDLKTNNDLKWVQDAMARPRSAERWILISSDKGGYEGPLPATVEEALTLLKKYGGD